MTTDNSLQSRNVIDDEAGAEDNTDSNQDSIHKRRRWRSPLWHYKEFVRARPGLVSNFDWLLYLTVWNPLRTQSQHSEITYEGYHAVVGLLSVWHQHIIDEVRSPVKPSTSSLFLDALEQSEVPLDRLTVQIETVIELRGMYLETHGRQSRFGALTAVEILKAILKMCMWSQQPGHLFLRRPGPEDLDQCEAEDELQSIMSALGRLRLRYAQQHHQHQQRCAGTAAGTSTGRSATQQHVASWGSRIWGSVCSSWTQQQPIATSCAHKQSHTVPLDRIKAVGRDEQMGMDLMWLAELLHIWRPVIYVSMLHRRGRDSWYPWLTSLLVDLLSMHFTYRGKSLVTGGSTGASNSQQQSGIIRNGAQHGHTHQHSQRQQQAQHGDASWPTGHPMRLTQQPTSLLSLALVRALSRQSWSSGEIQELSERRKKLLLYLLRPPMLNVLTRPLVSSIQTATRRLPLVNMLVDYGAGLMDTFTAYYTYTSGSS